jgi:hypothetical protein
MYLRGTSRLGTVTFTFVSYRERSGDLNVIKNQRLLKPLLRTTEAGVFAFGAAMEFNEIDPVLIQELVDKRVCCSKGEARRLVCCMPADEIRRRLDRMKIVQQVSCNRP